MVGISAMAWGLAGCSTTGMIVSGGKMAVQVITGAEAKVRPLEDLSTVRARDYNAIRLGEVTTDVPAIIPAAKLAIIRTEMEVELGEESKKNLRESGKALVAKVAARFLKERGTFGGEARLDMIATLTDAESGEELARLFIEGISKSPTAGKTEHMAKENAKELVKYLAKKQKGEKYD
ncbi:MAG: hypothetical protein HRF43_12765 [Phycisphaerae bacterium]